MKARVLPLAPDLEVESEAYSTWTIENYRDLTKRERGPSFQCGKDPWCVTGILKSYQKRELLTLAQADTSLSVWEQCRACVFIPGARLR